MLVIVFAFVPQAPCLPTLFPCSNLCRCLIPILPASLDSLVINLGLDFGLLSELCLPIDHEIDPDYSLNVACLNLDCNYTTLPFCQPQVPVCCV